MYILRAQVLRQYLDLPGVFFENSCNGCLCLQFVCAFPADLFSHISPGHHFTDQCRWPRSGPVQADQGFTSSNVISHSNAIDTSKVLNPAPVAVYQTGRIGNFTYTLGGFVPGSPATVRLHFAETYWTAAGLRTFNASINGNQVLTNFDIFSAAGGQNVAIILQFSAPANASGQYIIQFTTLINNALVNGIEILSSSVCPVPTVPGALTASATSTTQISMSWSASSSPCSAITYKIFRSTTANFAPASNNQIASGMTSTTFSDGGLTPSTTYYYLVEAVGSGGSSAPSSQASATTQSVVIPQVVAIDAGGAAVGSFLADQDYVGGNTISHSNIINTTKVNNPAPTAVYQTGRVGNFAYTIGGFKTTTNYLVRLHFCETYWTAPGLRVFNVTINGSPVLTNFDIFAAAGGQNIANIQQFTEPVNSNGQLVIQFTTLVNNALIDGIEVIPGTPKPDFSFSAVPGLEPSESVRALPIP